MNAKDFANAGINRVNRGLMRLRLAAQYRLGLLKEYQPNPFDGDSVATTGGRQCRDRFEAISSVIPQQPLSFLDLGCNAGYFSFRLAERGGFGIGVELGRNESMACQTLAAIHRVRNVAFSRLALDPDNVRALPSVDLVVFMSLFHHFVRYYGQSAALGMLDVIGGKAGRFLVFETGQPDEDSSWAEKLAFMGPDPKQWAEERLTAMGFGRVHSLGLFPTSVSDVQRHLLVGERI